VETLALDGWAADRLRRRAGADRTSVTMPA
jgi:hypothetical protein